MNMAPGIAGSANACAISEFVVQSRSQSLRQVVARHTDQCLRLAALHLHYLVAVLQPSLENASLLSHRFLGEQVLNAEGGKEAGIRDQSSVLVLPCIANFVNFTANSTSKRPQLGQTSHVPKSAGIVNSSD